MNVLIEIRGGVPEVVGGTPGIVIHIIDYDVMDTLEGYEVEVINPMTEEQIRLYIRQQEDEINKSNQ